MATYKVTHIRLSQQYFAGYQHITHLFLENRGMTTKQEAVSLIQAGNVLYTVDPNTKQTAILRVVRGLNESFVRTSPDHVTSDNLLNLPRF